MESFNISRTLSRAWRLVVGTLPSAGLFLLVVTILLMAFNIAAGSAMKPVLPNTSQDSPAGFNVLNLGGYIGGFLVGLIVTLSISSFSVAGSLYGLLQYGHGNRVSFADCVRAGILKVLPVLGLMLLWYLAVIVGSVLLVVPAIMLTIMWSASLPALINENIGVIRSFGRSRALTKGSRGRIFLLLLICLIIVYGGMFAVLGLLAGTNMSGLALAMRNQPALYAAQIPLAWAATSALNALLASIYLETLAINGGGPAGHLDEVFA